MIELFRSNDPVLMSFADALLNEAGIEHAIVDQNMSVMEGSLGILPRRMLVAATSTMRAPAGSWSRPAWSTSFRDFHAAGEPRAGADRRRLSRRPRHARAAA